MDSVGDFLEERRNEPIPWQAGLAGTILLHAGVVAAFLIAGRLTPHHEFISPQAVSVHLVSLASVRGAASEAPAPEPSRPVIEKPAEQPAPTEKALPLPEKSKPEKSTPHPREVSPEAKKATPSMALPGSGGTGAEGGPAVGAASSFGATLSAFDSADFNYSYYIGQMLTAIGSNWFKPTEQSVTPPVIYFRIQRSGMIMDARIERTSGLPFVDRAAIRAVLSASPLPPLPADFHEDTLGVHLKFQ